MWRELVGTWGYEAGTSGDVTLPNGAIITQIYARSTAGGSVTIFGGDAIPIVAATDLKLQFNHALCVARTGALTVSFTTTTSFYIEYVKAGNT